MGWCLNNSIWLVQRRIRVVKRYFTGLKNSFLDLLPHSSLITLCLSLKALIEEPEMVKYGTLWHSVSSASAVIAVLVIERRLSVQKLHIRTITASRAQETSQDSHRRTAAEKPQAVSRKFIFFPQHLFWRVLMTHLRRVMTTNLYQRRVHSASRGNQMFWPPVQFSLSIRLVSFKKQLTRS